MAIRPAYVKCDALSGGRTVHHQVGPQGKSGELEVAIYLKDVGRSATSQTEDPRIEIWDRPTVPGTDLRTITIYVDGQNIFEETRRAYE